MLVDIVSKNGNLLLSIPVRGDGTVDEDEVAFLQKLASWMNVNGEGIFGTRPWKIFGEGPTEVKGGMFQENKLKFTPADLRFTTKDGALYVFALGVPTEDIVVKALGNSSAKDQKIAQIKLLGSDEQIKWEQGDEALTIHKPENFPTDDVVAFKVTFK